MMKILPYDSFTILTPDILAVVLQRLNGKIEDKKMLRFSREHALYEGTISEQGFKISRIIHHRNSVLPVIEGRFEVQSHQTAVHIQMKLHPFVMGFLGFWLLSWYSAVIPISLAGAIPINIIALFVGMPIMMLVIFWAVFWTEANRSRSELAKIIQGQS
ncbi:hypothetical protein NIES2101_21430 [Calothrix sp. HK-06]|nr:hypothetical protein NIES2101_21430 [Calothrix sp. HK-06]